jgi:hypothetical protein
MPNMYIIKRKIPFHFYLIRGKIIISKKIFFFICLEFAKRHKKLLMFVKRFERYHSVKYVLYFIILRFSMSDKMEKQEIC